MANKSTIATAILVVGGAAALLCGGCGLIVVKSIYKASRAALVAQKAEEAAARNHVAFMTTADLEAEYAANELAADAKYKGRWVGIEGKVQQVGADVLGDAFVLLEPGVQCMFADEWKSELATVKPGDSYRWIVGRCEGKLGVVILRDCEFRAAE